MSPLAATARDGTRRAGRETAPVVEIFGPTVQGEGPDMGRPAYFVRFGGCDFRCTWCDSMHAVDPSQVRATAQHLEPADIIARIDELQGGPDLVVLSGGNPALHDLASLVTQLHDAAFEVAVETQGSRWKPWLADVDRLVVSPKGPTSGMDTAEHRGALARFLADAQEAGVGPVLKAVIFEASDLEHARWMAAMWPDLPLYLSTGTDVGLAEDTTHRHLLTRLRWLSETVAVDPTLRHACVGVQLHVLAWGTRRGV
ncbi:MAG: 7-carboxy-7-deazaguanine synthase QueE [Solirubrobacteraceae bacterium]